MGKEFIVQSDRPCSPIILKDRMHVGRLPWTSTIQRSIHSDKGSLNPNLIHFGVRMPQISLQMFRYSRPKIPE